MPRIVERPRALLDGAAEPGQLLHPGSDAARYFERGLVIGKASDFILHLAMLTNPEMPRMPGITRTIRVDHHRMVAIQGEDGVPEEAEIMYAFALGPDSAEYIEMRRITGARRDSALLSWVDAHDEANPVFRTPDLAGAIDDPAKISELTQILAAGQDATEWALD